MRPQKTIRSLLFIFSLLTWMSLACSVPNLLKIAEPTTTRRPSRSESEPERDPRLDEIDTVFPLSDEAVVTRSGLMYDDLVVGEGAPARKGDTVAVIYTGYLEDGMVFDSNVDSNSPFEFQLGAGTVIPGWDEGLTGMRVGGTRLLVIPPDLAYGRNGAGAVIPPDATLTFSVTLVEIK